MSAPDTPRSGPGGDLVIRPYEPDDEGHWLECRLLAFFDTAYYDDVVRSKTSLVDGSFELVAEDAGKLVGLIDVELDSGTATIDSIAVHPSARRRGVGRALLDAALARLPADVVTLDAWTRDDPATVEWYLAMGFREADRYLHVYLDHDEPADGFTTPAPLSRPVKAFMHAAIEHEDELRARFRRVHVCRRYVRAVRPAPTRPERIG